MRHATRSPRHPRAWTLLVAGLLVVGINPAHARSEPPEPAATGKIAFVSKRAGTTDIWIMDADGRNRSEVAAGGRLSAITEPVWSPDGTRIGFVNVNTDPNEDDVDDDDTTRVWVVDPDRANLTQLTRFSSYVSTMTWSPDSRRIAFDDARDEAIWVINADGTSPTLLHSSPGSFDDRPAWSPDGRRIAFVSTLNNHRQIWVMNPDGSERTQLTFSDTGSVGYESLAWSPDSTRIAYTSDESGTDELWVVETDTAKATNLTRGAGGADPAWSPDGTRIAFTRGNDLWVVDTDTANATDVTHGAGGNDPAWSPDGTRIAFASARTGNSEIWVIRADGADPLQLTNSNTFDGAPRWQPEPHDQPTPGGGTTSAPATPGGSTTTAPATDTGPDNGLGEAVLPRPGVGYWAIGADGKVYNFGDAPKLGEPSSPGNLIIDIEAAPHGSGYWTLDSRGVVTAFGPALHGSLLASDLKAGEKAVSMSGSPTGAGYWIFTNKGRMFAFGDANKNIGDVSTLKLNGDIVDSSPTPTGNGYYLTAADGGVFALGDAVFQGSMGAVELSKPVVAIVPDPDGEGYWQVASDGGVFAFKAIFHGSMGHGRLNKPIRGMVPYGTGYLMVAEDGGVFNFSNKPFSGSTGNNPPAVPMVSITVLQ